LLKTDIMNTKFVFGIETLDEYLGSSIANGALVVVAGHPGTGKTTLASTICYRNALQGRKCLYISFQEDRDKLFRFMKILGIDFESVESKGMLRFVHLPVITTAEDVYEYITRIISEIDPQIIVVDSITPLLKSIGMDVARRSYMRNYFYEIASRGNKLVVLVAEIPLGMDTIEFGDIEFVADVVLILRHRVSGNLLVREIEIRKSRGSPLNVARATVSISEGSGIKVWFPVILEKIPAPPKGIVEQPCDALRRKLGGLHKGDILLISYPPDARPHQALEYILGLLLVNNAKGLLISYKYSASNIKDVLMSSFKGLSDNAVQRVLNLIEKNLIVDSINPTSLDLSQLVVHNIELIREIKPDIVVLHDVDLVFSIYSGKELIGQLFNMLNYMRLEGVLIIEMTSNANKDVYDVLSTLSDAIIRFELSGDKPDKLMWKAYVWKHGSNPYLINSEEFHSCLDEIHENILSRIESSTNCSK